MRRAERFTGPATIVQGDRQAEVECQYEVERRNGVTAWRGGFAGADSVDEPDPGEAELRFGQAAGQIVVRHVFTGTGEGSFEGTGPQPG